MIYIYRGLIVTCVFSLIGLMENMEDTYALNGVSFTVKKGELFGLLGPNGAGKTTMIRVVLDIFKPDSGSVSLFGSSSLKEAKERIGYLPEEGGLYRKTKVFECIKYFAELKGMRDVDQKIDSWLKRLGLSEYRDRSVQELSKGLHRKVQFIISVIHKPDILILDEPFYGLDPVNKMHIEGLIQELKAGGMTVIMSTHQMDEVEKMCDRILLINKGRTVLYGDLGEIKGRYGFSIMLDYAGRLPRIKHVSRVNDHGNMAELLLEKDADTQMILKTLADSVKINSFVVKTRSLNEIFIEEVGK
jgi:ABC-2 type transport system ATP-binding protein